MARWKKILCFLLCLCCFLLIWKESAEPSARWWPDYEQGELSSYLSYDALEEEDFAFLLAQTGISAVGLERLAEAGRWEELEFFQKTFFMEAEEMAPSAALDLETPFSYLPMTCFQNSPISWEEYLLDAEGNRGAYLPMVPLEEGDILLTPNSHSFGYRQGHAALVVDTEQWYSLECLVLGQNSALQSLQKWRGFPAVIILRPKETALAELAVDYALDYLQDVPYDLTVGVFSEKNLTFGELGRGTQCSHLVWQAYAWAGVDLDANGWGLVTPYNLAMSENLDLVQIWGIDPEKMWS